MSKLTLHRLFFILTFGVLYSVMHLYFELDVRSMTFAVIFIIASMTLWDWLFLKRPEWKDEYNVHRKD